MLHWPNGITDYAGVVDPVLQTSGSLIPATNRKHPEVLIPTKVHAIVAIAPRNFRLRKYRIDNAVSLSLALISTRPGLLCEIVNLFGLGCRVALASTICCLG